MSQTKDEFLQQYVDGLRDSQNIKIGSQLDQDLMDHNLEVDDDYGYSMGVLMGRLMDTNIEGYEDQQYSKYVDTYVYDDELRDYYENTNIYELRDDPSHRMYSNQDLDIVKHGARNYLYQEMKQALDDTNIGLIDDENVFDVLNNSIEPHCHDKRTREMLSLANDVMTTTNDWEHADDPSDSEYAANNQDAWDEYERDQVSESYHVAPPKAVKDLMNDFGSPDYHNINKVVQSELISEDDKLKLIDEHAGGPVDIPQSEGNQLKHDVITAVNHVATSSQSSVKDSKVQQNDTEVKPTVKSKKHVKKRRKTKSNDGPEM